MNVPVTLQRLWIQVTADRRRFGIFCAMLGVGLLLWARLIVITNTPRTAVAVDKSQQSAQTAQPPAPSTPAKGAPAGEGDRPKTPLRVVLATSPQRDPFVISSEHFPRPNLGFPLAEDAGKSLPKQAEDFQQLRYAYLASLAERLKLEAILAPGGGQPLVVINARTYRLNDEVPVPGQRPGEEQVRFRLVEVAERSATLEYEDYRFQRTLRGVMSEK